MGQRLHQANERDAPLRGRAAPIRAEQEPSRTADLLRLQRLAGNAAVAELIVQRAPALPADAPTVEPSPAPAQHNPLKFIPPPPPVRAIPWSPVGEGEGPHRGVDIAADAQNVTITFVYKDWNFPKSEEGARIDWLHEPNVSIQVSPGAPTAVVQAAISAINVHLRNHGEDLVELSVSPQVGVPTGDDPGSKTVGPQVGLQAQAELHITATFSLTASSAVTGATQRDSGRFDIKWDQPISIGVLYHLESKQEKPEKKTGEAIDDTIGWIESQFDSGTLDDGGKEENLKDGEDEIIRRLLVGMTEAAGSDTARIELDLGPHERALPEGMEKGLTELVRLIKFSHPHLESISSVTVNVLRIKPGAMSTTLWRSFQIQPGPTPGTPGDYPVAKGRRRKA